jgi:hypothetical protein
MKNKKIKKYKVLTLTLLVFMILLITVVIAIPYFHQWGTTSKFEEDSGLFSYNFSANVTINVSDDDDDTITYTILGINSTLYPSETDPSFYTWFDLNQSTGMLTVNVTGDNQTGRFNLSVFVENEASLGESRPFYYIINATNDAPNFTNMSGSYNLTQDNPFTRYINATDETSESHYPLTFNITWLSNCTRSFGNSSNCTLFSFTNVSDTAILMNFTPSLDDVGIFYANISVSDYGENYTCSSNYCSAGYSQNQTTNYPSTITFNVFSYLSINVSDCQNSIFQENTSNICQINITTTGSNDLLNISSNASLRNSQDYTPVIDDVSWFYGFNQTNSTNNSLTIYINVTPGRTEVGNWTINFSAIDLNFNESDDENIYIYVNRTYNDIPDLEDVSNTTTSINYFTRINLTVYDDDLLIPDKNVALGGFNETIDFTVQVLNRSNLSQELSLNGFDVEITSMPVSGTNRTEAKIEFTPNSSESGGYIINITVNDDDGSKDWENFNLTIIDNENPQWLSPLQTTFVIYEDNNTFLNLSGNVTDPDNDSITFSYVSNKNFPVFNLNSSGLANFTSIDEDVGEHIVNITLSDGFLTNTTTFNFTVYNINDTPYIEKPIQQSNVINATVWGNSSMNCSEDSVTTIYFWMQDEDFIIPVVQKGFYDENLTVNLAIQGPNTNLFNLTRNPSFPPDSYTGLNRSQFYTIFTPNKSDVGDYNITLNITDNSNLMDSLKFNLTVLETDHNPELMDLTNKTLAVNSSLYYRINATDIEDGSSNVSGHNLTFSYNFLQGSDFINNNQSIFNTTSGEMNKTFNSSEGGKYHINITVNDSGGKEDSASFWIFVYDYPNITFPLLNVSFSLTENVTSNLTFRANHSVGDNLTYYFYLEETNTSTLKNNVSYFGNDTNYAWVFTPGSTDDMTGNLTLVVFPANTNLANRMLLNTTKKWNITIENANYPLEFSGLIGGFDKKIVGGTPQTVILSDYFNDEDAKDPKHNQTITFSYALLYSSGGTMGVSITNWVNGNTPQAVFSSTSHGIANFTITGFEINETNSSHVLSNVTSNIFTIELNVTSGGGDEDSGRRGGGTTTITIPIAFKILSPETIKEYDKVRIVIPLGLINLGDMTFRDISFYSAVYQNGTPVPEVAMTFDVDYINILSPGIKKNTTLTLIFPEERAGEYEILINATSISPKYTDWAKIRLTLDRINESDLENLLIFVEEFIAENPECVEITEIVREAREHFNEYDFVNARLKAEQALNACKDAISQVSLLSEKPRLPFGVSEYVIIVSVVAFLSGIFYYFVKRRRYHKKIIKEKPKPSEPNSFYRG